MSKFHMETLTCPECKTEQKIKMWDEIDSVESVKARDEIITGELFEFKCKKCSFKSTLAYRCFYRDEKRKLAVWLLPEEGLSEETQALDKGYIKRIVSTPNEMKEKIMINQQGMDDRIVELLKMVYTAQLPQIVKDEKIAEEGITEMFLDFPEKDKYAFVIFFENIPPLMIPVEYDVYIRLYEDFIELVEEGYEDKFTKVDCQWSKNFFTRFNSDEEKKH